LRGQRPLGEVCPHAVPSEQSPEANPVPDHPVRRWR
jgi:hypothetical protein